MPIPVPNAVIRVPISFEDSILSNLALSTLRILPLNGKTAWQSLFLPCLAEPPAESPSTIKSSDFDGSLSMQSASFPGKFEISSAPFLLVSSRAFLAASLATAASTIFDITFFASLGCSSNQLPRTSFTQLSTMGLISDETNLSLV